MYLGGTKPVALGPLVESWFTPEIFRFRFPIVAIWMSITSIP